MSLVTQITNLATRTATESKTLRTMINGNASDLSSLTTSAKSNLVSALNELDAAISALSGGGSATDLDALTDVVITSAATGHILRHNGTVFVNVLGTTFFEIAGAAATAQAAAIAASQPVNSNLTAIAAVASQTTYGRNLLTVTNQAALTALLEASSETISGIVELATNAEVLTGTDTTRAVTSSGVAAAINALVAGAPGLLNTLDEIAAALGDDPNFAATLTSSLAGKQPLDTDLTQIAALTSAADKVPYSTGSGTWAMATFTAAGRALVDDATATDQRTTLSVYSQAEIGDPTTNFVTTFEAGLV